MKQLLLTATALLLSIRALYAQTETDHAGTFSLGTRNTVSMFSHDPGTGIGIGGQMRLQFSNRINTEWFLDYIPSKNEDISSKRDYHFGWSIMYYPGATRDFSQLLQPYLLAGHCFDYSKVFEQKNPSNYLDRWSMATQAGLGTHINFTEAFDCSLSAQYMLHFGKEIETIQDKDAVYFEKISGSGPDGHLLISVSFNYKLGHLW